MKKKVLVGCTSILLLLSICLYAFISNNTNRVVISSEDGNSIVNTNALTMMYETEYQSGEYQVSTENTWPQEGYIFNETLSKCENGGTLSWNSETDRVILQTSNSDRCYVYFDKEPTLTDLCNGLAISECIITQVYTTDGENGLYLHDGQGTYANADQEAGDNSYRYSGANPNNYICFGSKAETCPADNLYRVIGVFGDQVKLIKADFATSTLLGTDGAYRSSTMYYWNNNTGTNTWSESNLNTINLNTNYINNIGRTWSDLITQHTWQVGGGGVDALLESTAKAAYNIEMHSGTTYNAKIGLMYLNEYGYATIPQYWNYDYWSYSVASEDNWLNHANNEWTITRLTDDFHDNSVVYIALMMDYENTSVSYSQADIYHAIRPTFYLQPWVLYSSGNGTESNPYRIIVPENLIEFTVNYENFYAEDDMSFYDFVNSIYNNGDFSINDICQVEYNSSGMVYDGNGGVFPIVQDYIISETLDSAGNQNYRTGMYDPGLPGSFC